MLAPDEIDRVAPDGSCQRRPDCHLFRAGSVRRKGLDRARLPPPTVRDSPNVQQLSNRPLTCGVRRSLTEVNRSNCLR